MGGLVGATSVPPSPLGGGGEAGAALNMRSLFFAVRPLAPGETAPGGLGAGGGAGRCSKGRRDAGRYRPTGSTSFITRWPSSGGVLGVTPMARAKNAAAV